MFKTAITSGLGVTESVNVHYALARSHADSLKNQNAAEARNPNFQLVLETPHPKIPRNYVQIKVNSRASSKPASTSKETDGRQGDNDEQWLDEFVTPLAIETKKRDSKYDDPSEQRRSAQQLYVSKLKELDEISVLGMSAEATAYAQRLAMDIVLCVNAETISGQKTYRDLREVISQMVKRLALIGISLPTDTEKLFSLIKVQAASFPVFIQSRIDSKNTNSGHIFPLLMLAIRRHSSGADAPSGELNSNSNLARL